MFRVITVATAGVCLAIASCGQLAAQDITAGLLAHWKMDEGPDATIAVDSAGDYDGMVDGPTTGLFARVDEGYYYPSSGSKVVTTATMPGLGFNEADSPFSMFAFVKSPGTGTEMHIFTGNVPGLTNRWNFKIHGGGSLGLFHNGASSQNSGTLPIANDDQWHLIGMSRNELNEISFYVDDAVETLGTDTVPFADEVISLGGRRTASTLGYAGFLDDMRIYDRILSPVEIDQLLAQPMAPTNPPQWQANGSGSWFDENNWLALGIPTASDVATFGALPNTSSVTVVVDAAVNAQGIEFDNGVTSYVVGGTQTVTLDSDSGSVSLDVLQAGSHQFQTVVSVADPVTANVAAGGQLSFNNALNLNGNTLTKTGDGRLNINNQINSGSGDVVVTAGVLGGTGALAGDLDVQSGATVAPGQSPGTLSVAGNYTQAAGATLEIELAGADSSLIDLLDVAGTANLQGVIDISIIDGFIPQDGNSFEIVSSSGLTTSGLTLSGQTTGFSLTEVGDSLFLNFAGSFGIPGDFNSDGVVDAIDYAVWRENLGSTTPLPNDGGLGTPVGSAQFALWQSSYGATSGAGAGGASAPEPTSLALFALLGGLALMTDGNRGPRNARL